MYLMYDMRVLQQLKMLQGLPQIAYLGNLLRLQDRLPKAQMECLSYLGTLLVCFGAIPLHVCGLTFSHLCWT